MLTSPSIIIKKNCLEINLRIKLNHKSLDEKCVEKPAGVVQSDFEKE